AKKVTKAVPKKITVKKKAGTKEEKNVAYECGICGFRVIVDEFCGCVEEHVLICCEKKMKKKKVGKKA
ncbi:MAG: hypothetical protein JXB23_02475, partial [Candidatus Aminicenantes bacterium]|nr:hypothetical protein [Candidatus Aminicenantes bacterium]